MQSGTKPTIEENQGYTRIAQIVKPHGVRGEVKAILHTDSPEDYLDIACVFVSSGYAVQQSRGNEQGNQSPYRQLAVQRVRMVKNAFLFLFEECSSCEEASKLVNSGVFVEDTQLSALAEDEFFVHQLVGAQVFDTQGQPLGEIIEYFDNSAHGICEVKRPEGNFLFPTTAEVLQQVVAAEHKVIIEPLPGLLELNQKKKASSSRSGEGQNSGGRAAKKRKA